MKKRKNYFQVHQNKKVKIHRGLEFIRFEKCVIKTAKSLSALTSASFAAPVYMGFDVKYEKTAKIGEIITYVNSGGGSI